jgi:hypothetical protein
MERYFDLKLRAMRKAGTYPKQDLQKFKTVEEFEHAADEAYQTLTDFVEITFYHPVSEWLRKHTLAAPLYPGIRGAMSEEEGYFVTLDFVTEAGRDLFLKAFPKWTVERPKMWWDEALVGEDEDAVVEG